MKVADFTPLSPTLGDYMPPKLLTTAVGLRDPRSLGKQKTNGQRKSNRSLPSWRTISKWAGLLEGNGNRLPVPAKFLSWFRYRCVVAWILRFVQNTRLQRNKRILNPLKVREIRQAEEVFIKRAQSESFPKDIEYLKSKKGLPSRSCLLPLRPFLGAD